MKYSFNPHRHVKIWLSNNRDVFMNFENQTRLIEMREKNPQDEINLVYDSSLLNPKAIQQLHVFCKENNIKPVDAHECKSTLVGDEAKLYAFYEDEIHHLKEGGNLGVASDILRILSPFYRLGTYTDLDVPLDTNGLPDAVEVDAPFLLNVGSLRLLGKQEMVLALNELIIVADEEAAKEQIEKLHKGVLEKLESYSSDYVESVIASLSQGRFLNSALIESMKNRSEAYYIQKSTEIAVPQAEGPPKKGVPSRVLRGYINAIMSDQQKYLDFHRQAAESDEQIRERLRNGLRQQLSFIKWLFFTNEYNEIKRVLAYDDSHFIDFMMKKERSLYIKSIVVCTTGPMEIGRSFFGTYIMNSKDVNERARPVAFSHYGLDKAFLSRNVVPLHENAWGMLQYLGADVGVRSDSSWLDEGAALQKQRQDSLKDKQFALRAALPFMLASIKNNIKQQITNLDNESTGLLSFLSNKMLKAEKKTALQHILDCFQNDSHKFNIEEFRATVQTLQQRQPGVFSGYFSNRTRTIIEGLENLCHDTIVFRVAQNEEPSKEQDKPNTSLVNPGRYSIGMFNPQPISCNQRKAQDNPSPTSP